MKLLRNSALVQEHGGVGYYPTSGIPFVHVDTGNVRMWPRIPRLELAALFPDGKTKYLPSDGKPITLGDYKLALAKGMVSKTMIASRRSEACTSTSWPRPRAMPRPRSTPRGRSLPLSRPPIIAEDPREPGTPPAKLFTYASAGGMSLPGFGHKAAKPVAAPLPEYQDAEVVSAPEADDDHPDALAYVPFEIAGPDDRCLGHL